MITLDHLRPIVGAQTLGGRVPNTTLAGWRGVSSLETDDHQPKLYLMR